MDTSSTSITWEKLVNWHPSKTNFWTSDPSGKACPCIRSSEVLMNDIVPIWVCGKALLSISWIRESRKVTEAAGGKVSVGRVRTKQSLKLTLSSRPLSGELLDAIKYGHRSTISISFLFNASKFLFSSGRVIEGCPISAYQALLHCCWNRCK